MDQMINYLLHHSEEIEASQEREEEGRERREGRERGRREGRERLTSRKRQSYWLILVDTFDIPDEIMNFALGCVTCTYE